MKLNYTLLLTDISKKQGLGIPWNEMPLIIHTDLTTYTMAYITYEDEEYLSIVVPNKDGDLLNFEVATDNGYLWFKDLDEGKVWRGHILEK